MLLVTEQLTKTYGGFRALDGLDLTIEPGEILGLLGPNGSGKSTALRMILGFLRPSAGRATIAGHDCWREGVKARGQVAYLPGELRLYENMTGRQLISFLGELRRHVVIADVDALAKRFDIDIDRPIATLSSGMKRKVALLQVLAPRVPLVIMDEPTNTLDPAMRDELMAQVAEARKRGQAVLFSSHVLAEVEQVCDRVAILQRGKLVHLQKMTELRQAQRVRVHFRAEAPTPPTMPGLVVKQRESDRLMMEYSGQLTPLLGWLSGHPIADLHIEPLGLSEIYYRYHGAAA